MTFKLTPKEARKLWVQALRSGRYQQAQGALRKCGKPEDRYCCLGVACELFEQQEEPLNQLEIEEEMSESGSYVISYDGHEGDLPHKVQLWLQLKSPIGATTFKDNGKLDPDRRAPDNCLSEMNDAGKLFPEIADYIENEPEGLFHVDTVPATA